ncbi:MAG: ammonia-forming cytochrome c nitrite reductase subunit c552 [Acidobacteria bacterium]|nr:ammonia-forming cytochrome c nitrite reductase subunit c552 [Acidobacteriota bacterium]
MAEKKQNKKTGKWWKKLPVTIIAVTAIVSFILTALLINIFEKKQEAKNPFYKVVDLNDDITDPAMWGKNFPLQYDGYKRTVDMERTRYGGSEAMPRIPTDADPRSVVTQSKIDEDTRLKTMWAGYAFSVDFREERGHAYMLEDQTFTMRQKASPQAGTCVNCHASTYVPLKILGNGDIFKGFDLINAMPYMEARKHVEFAIACIDCHNPDNMALRVTRPAFISGIAVVKANEGIKNYDVNRDATRQEMRTYVCAQCHVEYYFKGDGKTLTFPWSNGLHADEILQYYEEIDFKDWTHKITSAASIKAQHPEFELWSQGIHSRSGVACADCHMPYKREGAMKISDHHVRSPILNASKSCAVCHKLTEEELKDRVDRIQDTTVELRNVAMDALVEFIGEIETLKNKGLTGKPFEDAIKFQRKAQFLVDFVESENSMGFHAPQEAARILTLSLNYTRQGQKLIAKYL